MQCRNSILNDTGFVKSNVVDKTYKVDTNLSCKNGGIYIIEGACVGQYTGKTIHFGVRSNEHFSQSNTAISTHMRDCNLCNNITDFKMTLVEDLLKRGKYSLSEREFLWNDRIRGNINAQKTLGS